MSYSAQHPTNIISGGDSTAETLKKLAAEVTDIYVAINEVLASLESHDTGITEHGLSVLTTKGDLLVRDTSVLSAIAAAAAGKVLTANGVGALPSWESLPAVDEVPDGGTTGQVLTKNSDTDQDLKWSNGFTGPASVTDSSLVLFDGAGNKVKASKATEDANGTITIPSGQNLKVGTLNALLNTAASIGASGYQKLSSGLMLQWGSGTATDAGATINFATSFGAAYGVTMGYTASSGRVLYYTNLGTSSFKAWSTGTSVSDTFFYIAVGSVS